MFIHLLFPIADQFPVLNVLRYLTFRTGVAVLTALIISFLIGPTLIRLLHVRQKGGQPIRDDGPESHLLTKQGTPTMGGLMILIAVILSTILWMDLNNGFVWVALGVTVSYGVIGFLDDYLKVSRRNHKGLPGKAKLVLQVAFALAAVLWIMRLLPEEFTTTLAVPFFKDLLLQLGWFFPVFAILVMVGSSNAVNLTDGLDGLAILPTVMVGGALGLIAYLSGHVGFSEYLQIPYVAGAGELVIFCGTIVGAGLGFLWFNTYPAQVFMGDVGALALGAALGVIAVIVRQELVLMIMGGVFVIETVSVILQVASFKLTGRRIFRMAPLHHHFELKGWPEPRVIVRFWIITVVLVLIGLATLKIR